MSTVNPEPKKVNPHATRSGILTKEEDQKKHLELVQKIIDDRNAQIERDKAAHNVRN